MAEKIDLRTLDLDIKPLIKSADDAKQAILALKEENKKLNLETEAGRAQAIRNDVEIKRLSGTYRAMTAAIQAQVSEGGKLQNQQMAVTESVKRLNQTEGEYIENNKVLKQLRKELNIGDANYAKNLTDLNNKISQNNSFLQDTKAANEGFRNQIAGAIKDTGLFGSALSAAGADGNEIMSVIKYFNPVLESLSSRFTDNISKLIALKTSQQASTVATEAAIVATETEVAATETLAIATTVAATETAALTVATESLVAIESVAVTETSLLTGETGALAATQTVQAGTSVAAAGGTGVLSAALIFLQLVLDALGIGLLIAGIVILVAAFKSFTPLVDKLEQGMAALGAVFNVITNAAIALFTGTKSLGSIFSSLGDDMDKAAESAVKLKKAQQDLEDAMALQEVQSAKNRAEINRLNVQAKDRTKTEKERISFLEKAADKEKKDFDQRKKNADEELRIAYERIKQDAQLTDSEFAQLKKQGLNYKEFIETRTNGVDELFDNLKNAQLKSIDIDNEYTVNLEKNINKQNKLIEDAEKERADIAAKREKAQEAAVKAEADRQAKIQKALDEYTESLKLQLELYRQFVGDKAKAVDEEISNAQKVKEQQDKIAKAEFDASKKTNNDKLKLQIAYNNNAKELADSQTAAIVKNADKEFEHILAVNKTKLDANKFLNDEMVNQEIERLDAIAKAEKDKAKIKLEAATSSAQEITDALQAIDDENEAKKKAVLEQRKEAENGAKLLDLENKRIAAGEAFQVDLASQLAEYDIKRAAEREDQIKRGADMVEFDKATAAQRMAIEQSVFLNKVSLAERTYNGIAELLGKATTGGKAMAIAQTTIDTYQSATAAFKALAGIPIVGPALGAVASAGAIAQGLATVRRISSTAVPKAERGGLFGIGGKRHRNGGTLFTGADGTRFEAEQGELIGVMNRNAAAHFMAFNNAFPAGGSTVPVSNYLEGGGVVSKAALPTIDYDLLAAKIGAATAAGVSALPRPVVAVQDIANVSNQMAQVQEFSNH